MSLDDDEYWGAYFLLIVNQYFGAPDPTIHPIVDFIHVSFVMVSQATEPAEHESIDRCQHMSVHDL